MAAMRMPPRQRMINMMYLVLTAILAMNVSKEVLDAFAVLDADLVRSEQAYEQRSQVEYAAFGDAARKFPDRFGALNTTAGTIRSTADSLVKHIERLKAEAIAKAEGKALSEVVGRGADGRDSLLALAHVEAKDDRETLTHMLVGSEPATPKDGDGTAKDLKRRIVGLRDRLKALYGHGEPRLTASLDLLFALDGRADASGTFNNWESLNFYDVPLAAGVATLSKLQTDIRSAENDMVKWLYSSATQTTYPMSSLTSAVIPRSSVVMLGDSFTADVFLAAYDEKNRARFALNGADDLPVGTDGKGKVRLKADRIGEQRLEGVIHYQGPNGVEEHPYHVSYQVMAPLLVASPTKMNVLYRGVDNPLAFSVPGVPAANVRPVIDNGKVLQKADGWYVQVNTLGKAHLSAVAQLPDGTSRTIGPVEFRVKDLPAPSPFVGGVGSTDDHCALSKLTAAQGIFVKLGDGCEFDEPFKATQFTISVMRNGSPIDRVVTGAEFDDDARATIRSLKNGDRISFTGIKAKLRNVPGPVYDLAAISLKVVK